MPEFGQARYLRRLLVHVLTTVVGQGCGDRKYSFTVILGQGNVCLQSYRDGEILFYSSTGTNKKTIKADAINQPISFRILYVKKKLAVPGFGHKFDPMFGKVVCKVFDQGFDQGLGEGKNKHSMQFYLALRNKPSKP